MKNITIITGSTLGNAEYVAEQLGLQLESASFIVSLYHGPNLDQLPTQGLWLIVTSTHGAGELPDNLQPLLGELQATTADLHAVYYGIIGLGDRSYDTFCQAAKSLDQQLQSQGAKRLGKLLEIDVSSELIPEDQAEVWLQQWLMTLPEAVCYANNL
ncbi:MAG: FMN-binding protein MioC [Candidatus Symbiodolus clandestinus]